MPVKRGRRRPSASARAARARRRADDVDARGTPAPAATPAAPERTPAPARRPGGAAGTPAPGTRRGFWVLMSLMVAAMLIAGAVVALLLGRSPASAPAPSASAGPSGSAASAGSATAAQLAAGRWTEVPAAPVAPRPGASTVWTGTEMIVWGGQADTYLADGAAFNPATNSWRTLARSPLAGRTGQAAVWDGSEMLVWGGTDGSSRFLADGAAYNPVANTWRMLPAAPISARTQPVALWTGAAMLVLGGTQSPSRSGAGFDGLHDGAAYDPATNRWTAMAAPPIPAGRSLGWSAAVQAGGRLIGFANWAVTSCAPNCTHDQYGTDLFTSDAHGAAWTAVPDASGALSGVSEAFWTGTEVIARGGLWCGGCVGTIRALLSAAYDPSGNSWSALPKDPIEWSQPVSVWTGAALLSFDAGGTANDGGVPTGAALNPGDGSAYDPGGAWTRLPSIPPGCGDGGDIPPPVWTGHQVVMYCFATGPNSSDGLVFTPGQ